MATPDIRDKLINQSKNSLAVANPKEESSFIPEIPSAVRDIALPPAVLDSLKQTHSMSTTSINNERRRIDETADALKIANTEIDSATKNIQAADSSLLLDFQGMFDSQYNRQFQRGRITTAQRKLKVKDTELTLERQREALDLREAGLPLDMFKSALALQTSKAQLSTSQANAIVSSNNARKQVRSMMQSQYSDDELVKMHKTGSPDSIWSAQELQQYVDDKDEFKLDMESKEIANTSNRLDLAEKLETRALKKVPLAWLRSSINLAETTKQPSIQIPGTRTTVPADKARVILSERLKAQQEAFQSTAESQIQLMKNDGNMSQAMSNLASVSSVFSGDGRNMSNLGQLNLLNITEDTIKDIPVDSVHPALRADFQNALEGAAILNAKTDNNEPVTVQDIHTFNQLVTEINTKATGLQKTMIDAVTDKGHKAGLKEWFSNGRMQTQDNSAAVLVANSISLPNLGDDQALSASYQVMLENLSKDILGDEIDFSTLEPEERTNVIFQSLLGDGFKGKVASRDKIIKALHAKNAQGVSPFSAYVANRGVEITAKAMQKLEETYPEYAGFFQALGRETGFRNPAKLAATLAELSFKIKEANPETQDHVLNSALTNFMSDIIGTNKNQWDSQLNPVRGSLMNLMFSADPSVLVDDALSSSFGFATRQAWDTMQSLSEPSALGGLSAQRSQELGRPQANIGQFSPVPLPIN